MVVKLGTYPTSINVFTGQAILGAFSLYDRYENGRRIVNVNEVVVHPDWDPITFANDIALLKLANIVQIGTGKIKILFFYNYDFVQLVYTYITASQFKNQGWSLIKIPTTVE